MWSPCSFGVLHTLRAQFSGYPWLSVVPSCVSSLGDPRPSCVLKMSRFRICACLNAGMFPLPPTVPSDVFFISSVWKGYYEYLGKRQPATLTVDWFNATSSKVNATFSAASQVQLGLTGMYVVGCLLRGVLAAIVKWCWLGLAGCYWSPQQP